MAKTAAKSSRKTKTVAYDVAEQLRTPEEMAAYLDAWFEEAPDDAAGIARALGDIARARGMAQVARDAQQPRTKLPLLIETPARRIHAHKRFLRHLRRGRRVPQVM